MTKIREVVGVGRSRPTLEGAGVHLHRAFGFHDTEIFDPFLLLDDFRGERPEEFIAGFPWHPHRGIETITYMLEGSVEHGDSLGNRGTIRPGEVQWMTAGSGIIHQEMPKPNDQGRMGGFQLWANLPAAKKMIPPRYQEFGAGDFPVASLDNGARAVVVSGEIGGVKGPVDAVAVSPGFFDVSVPPDSHVVLPAPADRHVFAYIFEGKAFFDDKRDPGGWEIRDDGYTRRWEEACLCNRTLVRFGAGDVIAVTTRSGGSVRFLLMTGRPLREPVAWGGPIVMNTREELQQAFRELEENTFLRSS